MKKDMRRPKSFFYNRLFVLFIFVFLFLYSDAAAQNKNDVHFYFVQITDTHFDDGNHLKKTKAAVEQINRLPMKIECVVHTGDITMRELENKALVEESMAVFSKLNVPVHYVPGNNDILPHKLESTVEAYTKHFGPLISMAEYNQVVFLFVYTEPLSRSFSINGFDVVKEVENHLKQSNGKPVIIFHHTPCASDFYNNNFHDSWDTQNKKKWITLINRYNVKAVIAGHFHRAEHHWLGKVPLYVAPPIAGYWGRQASYRIYEYRNGTIGYRTQYIE